MNPFLFQTLFILLFQTLTSIKFLEKNEPEDLENYEKFNYFETINESKNFTIKTDKKSIAYFESFERKSHIYISTNYSDFNTHKDTRISGKFYEIEPNTTYYIRIIHRNNPSVLKKYLYPYDLDESEIIIDDNIEEINYLYLVKNKIYTLNFENNVIKKMIKLSEKTLNSKIKIKINEITESELDENTRYYQIKEDFKGKIQLEIEENDAFIEFLSDFGEYKILTNISYEKEVENETTIIKIPKTQKFFQLTLTSDEIFNCSFSYGFSNLVNYYYYSKNNSKITPNKDNNIYSLQLNLIAPFKNRITTEKEFISFSIFLEKKPEQKIYLKYSQVSWIDDLLDEEISEDYCTKFINYLKKVIELYVYSDISQNPPNIPGYPNYHHSPINFTEEIDKISKVNRKFYEFYQEIQKLLTSTRDRHLNIFADETPKGSQVAQKILVLPFDVGIRKDKNGNHRVFIKKNFYSRFCREEDQKFIEAHLDIPIKSINDIDPFEYIQNWSKYSLVKNSHAQFSRNIKEMQAFSLSVHPIDFSEFYNEYEFDDNEIFYFYYLASFDSIKKDNIKLNNYYSEIMKDPKKRISRFYSSDYLKNIFLLSKGLKIEEEKIKLKSDNIEWDIKLENPENEFYFKCRVDEKNKVNVLVENSFATEGFLSMEKYLDCARLFYSNEYPIIIIQDNNEGGFSTLQVFLKQVLQIKSSFREASSFKLSEFTKKFVSEYYQEIMDFETCQKYKIDDITEVIDHYNYNGRNIEHKRTKFFDIFPSDLREGLNSFREEYFNSNKNLKKPTDIIIFTDSFSFSGGCGFVKGFQNVGGAIMVGYYGNPTKKGTDYFDSGQSLTGMLAKNDNELYKNLSSLGFSTVSISILENYDDYKKDELIPMEYKIDPVDYRVDIYSSYSDDMYDKFIYEGLEVHKLFNNGSYCNSKNDRLLFHDENCNKIEGKEYAHGGYKCRDNNTWDIGGNCEAYYCDIGYYFDFESKECKKDCSYDENKKLLFIHEKNLSKKYEIKKNMFYSFFILKNEDFYYSFETTKENLIDYPKLIFSKGVDTIDIENKNNETLPVEIKSINSTLNPNIDFTLLSKNVNARDYFYFNKGKQMYIIQYIDDFYLYIKSPLNKLKTEIKYTKYNSSMIKEDIIKIKDSYFSDFSGDIMSFKKNELYIIYLNAIELDEFHFVIYPIANEVITIVEKGNSIYMEKNKKYTLDFSKINLNLNKVILKLSRKTLNGEVTLPDKNIKLNSRNLFYNIDDNSMNQLKVEIGKENALIEVVFKQKDDEMNIIDLEGNKKIILKNHLII